ncbi:MAG: PqqD family protein [Scytonema sp. RU_4_4]|nr:PqqD family protein [Scytonema sp. RU_4_4]
MKRFRVPAHIATTFFGDSAVLLDSRKNLYYSLNNSAAEFWKFLMQMDSFDKALKEVLKLYEDSSELVKKDMEELVESLLETGLLESVQGDSKILN